MHVICTNVCSGSRLSLYVRPAYELIRPSVTRKRERYYEPLHRLVRRMGDVEASGQRHGTTLFPENRAPGTQRVGHSGVKRKVPVSVGNLS